MNGWFLISVFFVKYKFMPTFGTSNVTGQKAVTMGVETSLDGGVSTATINPLAHVFDISFYDFVLLLLSFSSSHAHLSSSKAYEINGQFKITLIHARHEHKSVHQPHTKHVTRIFSRFSLISLARWRLNL